MTTRSILFIVNAPSPNTTEFYGWLARRGGLSIEVLYTMGDSPKWKEPVAVAGYSSTRLAGRSLLARIANLRRTLAERNPDLVVLQGYGEPVHFAALAMLARGRRRWVFWGERIRPSPAGLRRMVKSWVVRRINRARIVYAAGRQGVRIYENLGVEAGRLRSMPYAKDLSVYRAIADARAGEETGAGQRPGGRRAVVCTARLVALKNVGCLIGAFSKVAPHFPGWDLELIGDGPMMNQLITQVPEALKARVRFHGFGGVNKQCEVYARSNIFVLPSDHDGWGMVVLEAMATGLPAIATEGVISAWDLIEDGETGFRIGVGDQAELERRLTELMSDPELCARMGAAAADRTRAYDLPAIAGRFHADLLALAVGRPPEGGE